jgi:hypothetical protein
MSSATRSNSSVRALRPMSTAHILEASDMTRPRSPAELHTWVLAKCEQLSATPEAKLFARSGRLPKKFYDEIYPLALFAKREFGGNPNDLVEPNLGNDNFDARIRIGLSAEEIVISVEITYAINGHDDSLRMEVLQQQGHVSLTGKVSSSGRRGSTARSVSIDDDAVDHAEMVKGHLLLIEERLRAKAIPRYGQTHILVVAVDDYLPLRDSADWEKLNTLAQALLLELRLDFGRVVFVGVAGRLFLSYDVPHIRGLQAAI